jgi:IS605 OrfB family transposase
MKQIGSKTFKNTKKMNLLWQKRCHYMNNYIHRASRWIVEQAKTKGIGTIVIGDIKGIKQENDSKTFVQVPIQRLVQLITYKAELLGIEVHLQKENYTSGVSAIDLEPIKKRFYDKSRRIQRGITGL